MKEWLMKQDGIVVRLYVWLVLHWPGGKWNRHLVMRGTGMSDRSMYRARTKLEGVGLLSKDDRGHWEVVNLFCNKK